MDKIILFGEIRSSKNSRQVFRSKQKDGSFRTIVAKSDNAKKQETDYHWQLSDRANKAKWEAMTGNLEYPFRLHFHFVRKTKARFDMINICQGPMDALVRAGYLPDDDANHVIPVFHPHAIDKENPRIEIWIANPDLLTKENIAYMKEVRLL